MTTIAVNKDSLYGDLQYTNGSYKFKGNGKVFKFKAHPLICESDYIAGFAGSANDLIDVKHFFEDPESKPPRARELYGLVLTMEGKMYRFDNYKRWFELNEPYSAIGSGRDFAMGAMALGASPKEAIKIASKHDVFTGMGVKGYSI